MALSNPDSCVIIDGETYDLISIPSAESKLVKSARRDFLDQLDLHSLADDLGKLGKFMRLAYDGVVGHTELQIKKYRGSATRLRNWQTNQLLQFTGSKEHRKTF